MRADSLGLFWEDLPPPPKEKKEVVKRTPPEPVWKEPGYIPSQEILQEALGFAPRYMTDEDLINAARTRDRFVFDIESFPNYFIASFQSLATGKVACFEMNEQKSLDIARLKWILENVTTVGFNSLKYDLPITFLAVAGRNAATLKEATNAIILEDMPPAEILRRYKAKSIRIDHIDLIEVAPLRANLKTYGGRLHVDRMQDLPFHPDAELTSDQQAIVKWYNVAGDLKCTALLHNSLKEEIDLRYELSNEVGIDLRSKSDPQIAEAVIGKELKKELGFHIKKPDVNRWAGTSFRYQVPAFIKFETPLLNWVLDGIRQTDFNVDFNGYVQIPDTVKSLRVPIGGNVYRMGNGGLHSTEQSVQYHSDENHILIDKDVTSYYPSIILNLHLFPEHLTLAFLRVYRRIVDRRINAKSAGRKRESDVLKIVINGMFGKLGNPFSIFYAPNLLIQVTLTGQLGLLMLIERLELAGIPVVSANTDGVMIHCPRDKQTLMDQIVRQWEHDTGFNTEGTEYQALYARDVNNYLALKTSGGFKQKGAFANPWQSGELTPTCLHKNPVMTICIEAVENYLSQGIPLRDTICHCDNFNKFVTVRNVKGGAVKVWDRENGEREIEYLGKSVRWYYAQNISGEIIYANSGNKVPKSEGAKPAMKLPDTWPSDIDIDRYVQQCEEMLQDLGVLCSTEESL